MVRATSHGIVMRRVKLPHAVLVVILSLRIVAVIILLLPICILAVSVATVLIMCTIPAVAPSMLVVVRLLVFIDIIVLRVTVLVARLVSRSALRYSVTRKGQGWLAYPVVLKVVLVDAVLGLLLRHLLLHVRLLLGLLLLPSPFLFLPLLVW